MSYVRCLRGLVSRIEYPADTPMNLDPANGRPVEMVLDLERLAAERPNAAWYDPSWRDMWRFGALMARDIRDPRSGDVRSGSQAAISASDASLGGARFRPTADKPVLPAA